jgi:hypothetical protein
VRRHWYRVRSCARKRWRLISRQFSRNDPHFGQTVRDMNRNIENMRCGIDLMTFGGVIWRRSNDAYGVKNRLPGGKVFTSYITFILCKTEHLLCDTYRRRSWSTWTRISIQLRWCLYSYVRVFLCFPVYLGSCDRSIPQSRVVLNVWGAKWNLSPCMIYER